MNQLKPTARTESLRPLAGLQPRPITVQCSVPGVPHLVRWHPGAAWLRVVEIRDRWRLDEGWWREPISRMYFEALFSDGRTETLFQDLTDPENWYAQRYPEPPAVSRKRQEEHEYAARLNREAEAAREAVEALREVE